MNHIEMMQLAEAEAAKSVCKRAQVGAVVRYTSYEGCVSNPWTTATGHNKRPCGGVCEGEDGRTLPDVMHAEHMAIDAALSIVIDDWERYSMVESALYVTRQPCINCAKLIVHAGIGAVYYRDPDDKRDGLDWLVSHGVAVNSGWLKEQMRARTLERVQRTWADRWQEGV